MKKRLSGHLRTVVGPLASALAVVFVLTLPFSHGVAALAQTALQARPALREFAGVYREQASGKTVRIQIEDGKLACHYADGSVLIALHLAQLSGDEFDIEEASATHEKIRFARDPGGKISGLQFGGRSYARAAEGSETAATPEGPSGAVGSPAPYPGPPPVRLRPEFAGKTGDFGAQRGKDVFVILERTGKLYLRDSSGVDHALSELSFTRKPDAVAYTFATSETDGGWVMAFEQHGSAPIWQIATQLGPYERLPYSVPTGSNSINLVKPVRGLKEIRAAAMAATPPVEKEPSRKFDLVELRDIDPAIRLDIRYATPNDFLGAAVYTQARAFLQRPAAEALVRAVRRLQPLGFGLLIHDGYRPWYVTKIFWDATPESGKIFVADPAQGSRHNRGCAVDLSLYDLKTNEPVEMTSLYDEMSPRAFPDYAGGTSLQRWRRDLLRWAMEAEGFTVYESEWWHYDYKDWREYGIGNVAFEKVEVKKWEPVRRGDP